MDELLQRVAEIRGMPASLIQRSAQARAEKEGLTVEAVLQEWAGEEPPTSADATGDSSQATEGPEPADRPDPNAEASAPTEITTDYLVQLAADAKRMPPKLILSSAAARAEHGNTTLEAVLADWAGVDIEELKQEAASGTTEDEGQETKDAPEPEAETPAAGVPAAAVGALTMDELLEKVTEVKGMPGVLAKRSAEARSKKTGETVEEVLAEWAGVDASSVAAGQTKDGGQATKDATPERELGDDPAEETAEPEPSGPEVTEAGVSEVDAPSEDEAPLPRGGYPRWLAAAFVLIPLLAVVYILAVPNGPDCGTAGQLLVDPATGLALNCDGSEFGTSEIDFMAEGAGVYSQCVTCHAADGSGGAGPAFSGGALLATFPAGSCSDQIEWVRVGTAGWTEPTYGATSKPVGGFGLMPSFGPTLSDEQLASVVLYERVQFGGQPLEEAELDCGLVEAATEGAATTEASGS